MIAPSICGERRWLVDSGVRPDERRDAAESMMNAGAVEVVLECVELVLEILGMPERDMVK